RDYTAGMTCQNLAAVHGVSEATIRRRLKARGVTIRQGPEYRRGAVDTLAPKIARAKTRHARRLHIGKNAVRLADMLRERGIDFDQQTVVGHYNIDFTFAPHRVAVEVVSGGGNPRQRALAGERIEQVRRAGWHVVELDVRSWCGGLTDAGADHLVALLHFLSSEPAAPG